MISFSNKMWGALFLVGLLSIVSVISLKSDMSASLDSDMIGSFANIKSSSFEEEYKLFLDELENGTAKHSEKSRKKRYVYLNTETNLDVGYLIVIPVTVVIPSMTNLFNNWRRKRSVDNFNLNSTSEEESSFHQSQVDRISSYFDLMNVPEKACQLRAVCELSAEPSNYFPLSDVILSKLNDPSDTTEHGHPRNSNSFTKPSLFQLFFQAADDGTSHGKQICEDKYSKSCKYSIDKLLNMPVMRFWKNLQSQLRLKFEDDSIASA